jgi:hypothetical protein
MAVTVMSYVFWDANPCDWVVVRLLGGTAP